MLEVEIQNDNLYIIIQLQVTLATIMYTNSIFE